MNYKKGFLSFKLHKESNQIPKNSRPTWQRIGLWLLTDASEQNTSVSALTKCIFRKIYFFFINAARSSLLSVSLHLQDEGTELHGYLCQGGIIFMLVCLLAGLR